MYNTRQPAAGAKQFLLKVIRFVGLRGKALSMMTHAMDRLQISYEGTKSSRKLHIESPS